MMICGNGRVAEKLENDEEEGERNNEKDGLNNFCIGKHVLHNSVQYEQCDECDEYCSFTFSVQHIGLIMAARGG
jgi:hypothetical protein